MKSGDDLRHLALEMRLGLADPERLYLCRRQRRQPSPGKLVFIVGKIPRRKVHPLQEVHRDDIGDNFSRLLERFGDLPPSGETKVS